MAPSFSNTRPIANAALRGKRLALLGVVVCASIWGWASLLSAQRLSAQDRSTAQESHEPIVLLSTGGMLRGEATREIDRWVIRSGRGTVVRLELHQVDLIARDFDDLLLQLRNRTTRDQFQERFKIARLCIQNGLFEEARKELSWLELDGARAATIQQMRDYLGATERLAQLQAERARTSSQDPTAATVAHSTPATSSQPSSATSAANSSSRTTPTSDTPASAADGGSADPALMANSDEAEELVAIDNQAFAVFVRRIQPPLLWGCAAARCHGPQGVEGFHLERLEQGAQPTRRMSEANYREVRRWALEAKAGETLVDWAMKAHGGNRELAWRDNESKTGELRAWLEWMRQLEHQKLAAAPKDQTSQRPGVRQASYSPAGDATTAPSATVEGPNLDPYDPNLFNQYRAMKQRLRQGGQILEPQSPLLPEMPVDESSGPSDTTGSQPIRPRRLELFPTNPSPMSLAPTPSPNNPPPASSLPR